MRHLLLAACISMTLASQADAQSFFVTGHFGGSPGDGQVSGENTTAPGDFELDDHDADSSIVGGASVGFRFPMRWVLSEDFRFPRARWMRRGAHRAVDWTEDWFTRWQIATEIEAAAGREFDFETEGFTDRLAYRTQADSITLMANFGVTVPIYWDVSAQAGIGIGPAFNHVETQNITVDGSKDTVAFAWQYGAGLEYAFNDRVSMGFGYRHIDLGTTKAALKNVNRSSGDFELDLEADEYFMRMRIDFYSLKTGFGRF
jgi:opacity protein-like surface antigen